MAKAAAGARLADARRNSGLAQRLAATGNATAGANSRGGVESRWRGRGFYVQVERCIGISDKIASVRHDEDKYLRSSALLKEAIEEYFNGQIPVELVDVSTLYAMEVRLMPQECHPRAGRLYVGRDAEAPGHLLFSKITMKKWPKPENVIKSLQELCRVPVHMAIRGREVKAMVGSAGRRRHLNQQQAVNSHPSSDESLAPMRRVEFQCRHDSGVELELHTNAEGRVEASLCPGQFSLSFPEESSCDKLEPSSILVPACFATMDIAIVASIKKKCTVYVVDHLNKPFGLFPLRITHAGSSMPPLSLRTKVDGKCSVRLGRGFHLASYDGELQDVASWPIEPLAQDLEVHDADVPQLFRISVVRVRFTCEIMLRTGFQEPARLCPFRVKNEDGITLFAGTSTDIGLAACDLPTGHYTMKLEPVEESPFVPGTFDVDVRADGTFTPMEWTVQTKVTDVRINLVTPDGEPATECHFGIEPQFVEGCTTGYSRETKCRSDTNGVAVATIVLLEPYIFRVRATGRPAEYMPQQFIFQTDRRDITIVVARTVLGPILESRVAIVVDMSGSMQVYMDDVKAALNSVITQQFRGSDKEFNIVVYTQHFAAFRPDLVQCSRQNLEDAMRFCNSLHAGGGSELLRAMEHAFSFPNVEAVYVVTDGKCDIKDDFLHHLRAMYFTHPKRPKVHTIGINCVPRRLTWQGLQAMALLAHGCFRPVCLEQAVPDAVVRRGSGQFAGQERPSTSGLDTSWFGAANATTDEEGTVQLDEESSAEDA